MRDSLKSPRTGALAAVLVFVAFSGDIAAQDVNPAESPTVAARPLAIALTVSGGVSLGAYQAGYMFYLAEAAKLNPDLFEIRLATGASAGMINTFLALMALGSAPEYEPVDSLFYKLWTAMKYSDLLDVEEAPTLALSSRAILEKLADEVEKEWNKGLSGELDMVLGATATRQKTYDLEVGGGFSVSRQEEKFVFRVQGQGPGRLPVVTNYVDRTYGATQPLLPFVENDAVSQDGHSVNFSIIRQILFASSAIPIVFPSQKIDFCMTSPEDTDEDKVYASRACPKAEFSEEFYDGSLADRRPLRLAHRIAISGLEKNEENKIVWRDRPSLEQGNLPDNLYFFYIDPMRKSYPDLPLEEDKKDEKEIAMDEAVRFFPSFGVFMRGFLTSARSKEVATLIDEHPEISDRIQLVSHDFPSVSDHLAKFFGFFDREFRKFDFYLGMRDAHYFLERKFASWMRGTLGDQSLEIVFPETRREADASVRKMHSWQPYFCLRAQIDGLTELRDACFSEELQDFSILLQVAFDRLYDHCRRLPNGETVEHAHCRRAVSGEPPPRLWSLEDDENAWKRNDDDGEDDFEHTMRLLELYQFHFRDLGLDRDDAALAGTRIRSELLLYVDTFAKKLPFGERLTLRLLGKPAVNFFMYAPPETIVYFGAGTCAEFAVSATLGQSNWLRYNFALQAQGFYYLFTEQPNVLTLTPMLGLETEIYPLSSPLLQTRFGLRVGYQFSTDDGFLADTCESGVFEEDSLRCSAPMAQAFISFSFYERIRLQGGVEWLPKWLPPMSETGNHVWNGFLLVGWQWISPF